MAIDYDLIGKCYYSERTVILPDGTVRRWKLELRPANSTFYRNRDEFDAPPDYQLFHDWFIDKVECQESGLERQIGLQTPPTIKITCAADYCTEEFADMVSQAGDYNNAFLWDATTYTGGSHPIHNTWLISYSDDNGTTWKWWFVGVQQPNEVTKFVQSQRTGESIPSITLTVQHINHWLLSQIEVWEWGKQIRDDAEVYALFAWNWEEIAYDTLFTEDIVSYKNHKIKVITTLINVTENWGSPSQANRDEAAFVKWKDAIEVLRVMLNRGHHAHRIYTAGTDEYSNDQPVEELLSQLAFQFYEQNYNINGGLGGDVIFNDLWVIAAVKPHDQADPFFGLFFNTYSSNGAGFDGQTCVDAIANLSKGFGMKTTYALYGDTEEVKFGIYLRSVRGWAHSHNVTAVDVFQVGWEFQRGEFIARGATFNVSAEDKNDTEFKVYAAGNQDRDDVEAKMQLHNLPNIRSWDGWTNPQTTGGAKSYRQSGFTLRRFWYYDTPTQISTSVPVRVHEYCEYYDGSKTWGDATGNPFVPITRSDATLAADMLLMQRHSGMPLIAARILSFIFSKSGIGKLTCSVPVSLFDYSTVGDKMNLTVPTNFKAMQGGSYFLESITPSVESPFVECIFIFIPND